MLALLLFHPFCFHLLVSCFCCLNYSQSLQKYLRDKLFLYKPIDDYQHNDSDYISLKKTDVIILITNNKNLNTSILCSPGVHSWVSELICSTIFFDLLVRSVSCGQAIRVQHVIIQKKRKCKSYSYPWTIYLVYNCFQALWLWGFPLIIIQNMLVKYTHIFRNLCKCKCYSHCF